MKHSTILRVTRLAGCTPVERALVSGSVADALRAAVEGEDGDARATVRPAAND